MKLLFKYLLVFGIIGVLSLFSYVTPVRAQMLPAGAAITVNSTLDNNIRDSNLTLQEAVSLMTGIS